MSYTTAILLLSFDSPAYRLRGERMVYALSEDYSLTVKVLR